MIVTIDFETYYSSEYSLRRMSEVDYIRDPRFQVIMCSVKEGDAPTDMAFGHAAVAARLARIAWDRAAVLAHNMRFDGAILFWIFGIKPRMYLCTLSMARALTHVAAGGSSLAKVSHFLGLPDKGDEVVRAMGKRLENFHPAELEAYACYCERDTENCYSIFQRFRCVFPTRELAVIDMTMRMFIEPQVLLDRNALIAHLEGVRTERDLAFKTLAHIDRSVFSSNQKFAALLESMGVDVPMKVSPITGKETFALAKNDRGFKELCDDDTQPPAVQAALAARLGAKSTIEETRTVSLIELSQHHWGNIQGWMPVPLKYYGAHTGRFSGDGGFNFQNLRRGSPIRNAIRALDGWRIIHRDSSQIEARMVAWLARCRVLLDAFEQGRDIYSEFATKVYRRTVTKKNVGDRFVGKTSILGLGYGMGAPRFRHTLFIGNGGISMKIDEDEASRIVTLYRREYYEIPALWNEAGDTLHRMIRISSHHAAGDNIKARDHMRVNNLALQPLRGVTWGEDAIWLPNGMALQYSGLRIEQNTIDGKLKREIVYDGGLARGTVHMFGGKLVENISQALARIVITDAATRVFEQTGYSPFLSTHDSLDYCAPEHEAPALDALLDREFAVRPHWALDLPLASEGGWGLTMHDAEAKVNQ